MNLNDCISTQRMLNSNVLDNHSSTEINSIQDISLQSTTTSYFTDLEQQMGTRYSRVRFYRENNNVNETTQYSSLLIQQQQDDEEDEQQEDEQDDDEDEHDQEEEGKEEEGKEVKEESKEEIDNNEEEKSLEQFKKVQKSYKLLKEKLQIFERIEQKHPISLIIEERIKDFINLQSSYHEKYLEDYIRNKSHHDKLLGNINDCLIELAK